MVAQTHEPFGGPKVREARRLDIEILAPIWVEFMRNHERQDPHFTLAADGELRWRALVGEMIFRDDGFVLVGELEGKAAGYCLGWLARNPPIYAVNTVGFISELAVAQDFRRRGLGSALITTARRWFETHGVREFQLATAVWNESAQAFWASLGGRPILTRFRFDV